MRGCSPIVALTAVAVSCLAATDYMLLTHAQEGIPSARRLAAMKADYKRPPPQPVENQALVDLGRMLFWDTRVSASGKTSCVSCHYPISAGRRRRQRAVTIRGSSPRAARSR